MLGGIVLLILAFVLSSSSAATVANVDGQPITLAAFNTWMSAAAVSGHASDSALPAFVPDSPGYVRCVAFERTAAAKSTAKVTDAALRSGCAAYRTALAETTMQFLIGAVWVSDEAAREGVKVTPAQVNAEMRESSASSGGLVHLLSSSHLTRAELAYQARLSLITQRLDARHAGPAPTITAAQISRYYTANHSSFGTATLAQATPTIRALLVAQAQAPAIDAYLQTIQRAFRPGTTCAAGYRLAGYCRAG